MESKVSFGYLWLDHYSTWRILQDTATSHLLWWEPTDVAEPGKLSLLEQQRQPWLSRVNFWRNRFQGAFTVLIKQRTSTWIVEMYTYNMSASALAKPLQCVGSFPVGFGTAFAGLSRSGLVLLRACVSVRPPLTLYKVYMKSFQNILLFNTAQVSHAGCSPWYSVQCSMNLWRSNNNTKSQAHIVSPMPASSHLVHPSTAQKGEVAFPVFDGVCWHLMTFDGVWWCVCVCVSWMFLVFCAMQRAVPCCNGSHIFFLQTRSRCCALGVGQGYSKCIVNSLCELRRCLAVILRHLETKRWQVQECCGGKTRPISHKACWKKVESSARQDKTPKRIKQSQGAPHWSTQATSRGCGTPIVRLQATKESKRFEKHKTTKTYKNAQLLR